MHNIKNKYYPLVIWSLALALTAFVVFTIIYLQRATYYGKVQIVFNPQTDTSIVEATSPLGTKLRFNSCDNTLSYKHNRFYGDIHLTTSEAGYVIFNLDDDVIGIRVTKTDNVIKLSELMAERNIAYKWHNKLIDFFKFILFRYWYFLVSIVLIIIIGVIKYRIRKIWNRLLVIRSFFTKKHPLQRHMIPIGTTFTLLAIYAIMGYLRFSNYVEIQNNPDQIEYHTCAVNQAEGYGFMIGGNMDNKIDYKIGWTDKKTEVQFNKLAGLQRLDRFPGYPFLIGTIYKITDNNPIIIKYFQLLLLVIIVCFLPIISYKFWGAKAYWGGVIGAIFLFIYLFKYVTVISPDLITVFINFFVITLYLYVRKNPNSRNIIPLAILSGISILFKASLMFYFVLMFIDFGIRALRHSEFRSKYVLLLILFLTIWLPYNIWSIQTIHFAKETAKEYLQFAKSNMNNLSEINEKYKDLTKTSLFKNFDYVPITKDDLILYKSYIEHNYDNTGYVQSENIYNLNQSVTNHVLLESVATRPHIFFMIWLPGATGLLDINNEYNNDGQIHSEWADFKDSFYLNDALSHKSAIYRTLSFYYHNPKYIISITHYKLTSYMSQNLLFYVIICLYCLLKTISISIPLQLTRRNFLKHFQILILCSLAILSILLPSIIPYAFIIIIFTLFFDKDNNYIVPLPLKFIVVNLVLFPIVTYGNSRYLIYYDTFLFIIAGFLFFKIIEELTFFTKNKTNDVEIY